MFKSVVEEGTPNVSSQNEALKNGSDISTAGRRGLLPYFENKNLKDSIKFR